MVVKFARSKSDESQSQRALSNHSKLGVFSRSCNFLMETYYVTEKALLDLQEEKPDGFKWEDIVASFKENFDYERNLEKAIRFPEAYSQPVMKNALKYFAQFEYLENDKGDYRVTNQESLQSFADEYYQATEQMSLISVATNQYKILSTPNSRILETSLA